MIVRKEKIKTSRLMGGGGAGNNRNLTKPTKVKKKKGRKTLMKNK